MKLKPLINQKVSTTTEKVRQLILFNPLSAKKTKDIKPNPPSECRFNVTAMSNTIPTLSNNNNLNNGTLETIRSSIHSGVIKNSDVPLELLNYTKTYNVSLECIWNITVMPGWKVSESERVK